MRVATVLGVGLLVAGCQWLPGTDQAAVRDGKKAIADSMRDPSSVQFRDVKAVDQEVNADSTMKLAVCGEVNGKNLNGAYVGFTRFIADPESGSTMLDPQLLVTDQEMQSASDECEREARRARQTGYPEIAIMACERSRDLAGERVQQAEFDMIYAARCLPNEDPPPEPAGPTAG